MKETFFAYVGTEISEHDLEQALADANKNFDYTVKVVRAGDDDEALFGKIVYDSYASNCRDPEIGGGMFTVGGYDLALLHEAALSIASGAYAFSNNEYVLARFVNRVFPVEPHTYFSDGAFTTYKDPSFKRTDDAGIESNYSNARDIIGLVNRILERAADDSLRQTIERLFDARYREVLQEGDVRHGPRDDSVHERHPQPYARRYEHAGGRHEEHLARQQISASHQDDSDFPVRMSRPR